LVNAVNTTLYDKLKFIFHRDIAPVASIERVPQTLDVNPSVPVKTVPEALLLRCSLSQSQLPRVVRGPVRGGVRHG
jgi:hypothetical protein